MHRSSACSSAARLSALSLPRRWSAVDLSRVHRSSVSSSFCWSAAFLSLVLPLLCLFVRRWSLTGPSLVCLFVSLCSVTYPSLSRLLVSWSLTCLLVSYLSLVCRWSAARLLYCSTRLLCRWSVARLLYCSARLLDCSARLLYCSTWLLHSAALLGCSTAPLGCSTRLLYCSTRLLYCSTRLLYYLTRLALRAFLFYLLCLAATLFTHTLSHAWCPVTLLSLTCCPTVVVTVVAASCGRA